ncbi:MAG: ABC transporter substrate-binding protein [Magnetococcus sp. DMHC-6]
MFRFIASRHAMPFIFALSILFVLNMAHANNLQQIQSIVDQVIATLNNSELSKPENQQQRRDELRRVIYQQFDFEKMAQSAVGFKWQKFKPEQKKKFVELFRQILENAYLTKIERYQGEKFIFNKEVELSPELSRVDSVVYASNGQNFNISYHLYPTKEGWKIFDLTIEGVSVVANYRSQFNQILGNSTIDKLIEMLEKKVSENNKL